MSLSPKVAEARSFAIEQHKDQMYGNKPYSFHLDCVYEVIVAAGLGEEYQIAAYLHDILEDTSVTKDELSKKYGEHITDMVFAVSGFGANRKERHADMKQKMLEYPHSIILKQADRLVNMRFSKINRPRLFQTYVKEHTSLNDLFEQGNSTIMSWILETMTVEPRPKRKM